MVANALLFLPLGAALSLLDFRLRTTVLIAFSVSALIEITQLFVPGRTTAVDDVLLNTLGALLGHALVSAWPLGKQREDHAPLQRDREHA